VKVLIKLGGTLLDAACSRQALAAQITAAAERGLELVVVHGGGKQMTRFLTDRGVESRFVNGLRVTTPETLDAVVKVVAGSVNRELVAALAAAGARAVGICGIDGGLVEAEQMDPALGAVGRVTGSNPDLLHLLTENDYIPVVACVGGDSRGNLYNVNADQMAAACAAGYGADLLIFLTDVEGVLDADKRLINTMSNAEALGMINDGVIQGGMFPKVKCCLKALRGGVRKAHIIDGRHKHAVLLEMFTDRGIGTEIVI